MRKTLLALMLAVLLLPLCASAEDESALYPIRENGLWGYVNRQGEVVIEPQWQTALPFSGDTAVVSGADLLHMSPYASGTKHADGLIDRQGSYLVEPIPGRCVEEFSCAYRITDYTVNAEGRYNRAIGFYDKASGFYQPPRADYDNVFLSDDGSGPIAVTNSDNLTGYVSRETGETVIPFQFSGKQWDDAAFFGGYACPMDELWLYSKDGAPCGWAEYEDGVIDCEADTEAWPDGVESSCGEYQHLIDTEGHEVTLPDGMTPISCVRDGYVIYSKVMDAESEKYDGCYWVRYGWDDVIPYSESTYANSGIGLARVDGAAITQADPDIVMMSPPDACGMVCFLADSHETENLGGAERPLLLAGHMDTEGNVIVPPTYNIVDVDYVTYEFVNGYAVIEDFHLESVNGTRWVIMDTAGNEILSREYYVSGGNFTLDGQVQENGLIWYCVWQTGINATDKHYGLIRVSDGQAEYLTDAVFESYTGGILKNEYSVNFAEGLHPVQINGLWGYIDESGAVVIEPAWDAASIFRDGLALVEKDGKLSYIDRGGVVVWQEK